MFEIIAHYQEADSFESFEKREPLGILLQTLEEAEECLSFANKHYKYLEYMKELSSDECNPMRLKPSELIEVSKTEPWFDTSVDEEDYSYNSEHTFNFKGQSINSFYTGCHNTLYKLYIKES